MKKTIDKKDKLRHLINLIEINNKGNNIDDCNINPFQNSII